MPRHRLGPLEVLGLLLLVCCVALTRLSQAFVYGEGHLARPILAVVAVLLIASVVYFCAVSLALRQPTRVRLKSILLFAVLFRLVLLPSAFVQEDDIYRYIWDGQVTLQGISPYQDAPEAVLDARGGAERTPLASMARQHPEVFDRINYPEVPTIYPPVAQAAFAIIQAVVPWNPQAVRTSLLLFDVCCILLLVAILSRLGLPRERVLIYAWSPLVLKEFANSGHLDTIAMAAVLVSILAVITRRWALAGAALAVGIASKYFPLVLVPALGSHLWHAGRRAVWLAGTACLGAMTLCFAPFAADGWRLVQGLAIYAHTWELNASLFPLFAWVTAGLPDHLAPRAARALAVLVFVTALVWHQRGRTHTGSALEFTRSILLILGLLFLVSPVGNPWYLCWIVPLLCVHPSRAWLLLTALIHLYYVGFFIEYHVLQPATATWWAVLRIIEYGPFYAVLIWETWSRPRMTVSGSLPSRGSCRVVEATT